MKTILERAKEAVIDPFDPDEMLPVRMGYLSMLERRGFVAGAMSELNELLRWHKIQSDKSGFATLSSTYKCNFLGADNKQ